MMKKMIAGIGLAAMVFGIWVLTRAHSEVGVCSPASPSTATAQSGLDSGCVQTLMGYAEGFVFVAAGLVIVVISLTMISRHHTFDMRAELKAVPRTWKRAGYVITSESEEDAPTALR